MSMYNQPRTNNSCFEHKDGCFVQRTVQGFVGPHGAAFFVLSGVPP